MIKLLRISFASLALVSSIWAVPLAARPMTETDLATLKRLSNPAISPDGTLVVYQLRETDLKANKGRTDLYLMPISGGAAQKIASKLEFNEHDPAFSPDGLFVYYLSNESGSDQLWRYDYKSAKSRQLSRFNTDVSGFKLSPDGKRVALWGDINRDCMAMQCEKGDGERGDGDRAKPGPGSGREYDALFVRHWDSWETPGNYSRIFTYGIDDGGKLYGGHPLDEQAIHPNEPAKPRLVGDAPSKPFGGGEEMAWSADSASVYYAMRLADKNEPTSTNLDIYRSHQNYNSATNLTSSNRATDTMPAPSPDGKYLAYAAMARPGYESDRLVIQLVELATGKTHALTKDWDRSPETINWASDSKSIFVTASEILDTPIFKIDLSGQVTRLTEGGHVSAVLPLADGDLIYGLDSIQAPTELYRRSADGAIQQITNVNGAALAQFDRVDIQRFDFAGANGDQVWGQIIKPLGAAGKLPVLFLVHGGPQGSFGNSWSFRWNPKVMASQGYGAVTVDFHGSTGYGQAFTDSINKDWGGKPLEDLKLGLAAAGKNDAQIDIKNACALGGSYGGYMMNWISGNWKDGFKCLVNHAGVFDARAMAFETEELWFDEWEHGGPYYAVPGEYEKWNPVNHVTKWKTPMLVIHGEKDFRIPYSQSLAAFTALQRQGVESKLLIFPDENHWILKPQNSIQWHRAVFGWLAKHLKGGVAD
jgi:dipeptidyl aminopeptidase/acylaminoacyl peptidase